jgi:hypothetical protein
MVGMGGQQDTSYSSCSYHQIRSARILIEPTNAVPLFIQTHTSPTNTFQFAPTWSFDPLFLRPVDPVEQHTWRNLPTPDYLGDPAACLEARR